MAAAAPLRAEPRPARRPPSLRLAPPLRRRHRRRAFGDAAFATTLAVLLGVGILSVLLLNTAMQTQADQIAATQHRLSALHLALQQAQTTLDQQDAPGALAARAGALHMRPAVTMPVVVVSAKTPRQLPQPVSARGRAKRPGHAG